MRLSCAAASRSAFRQNHPGILLAEIDRNGSERLMTRWQAGLFMRRCDLACETSSLDAATPEPNGWARRVQHRALLGMHLPSLPRQLS